MRLSLLGLDVGGANLKAAHCDAAAASLPFELWRRPAELPVALRRLLDQLPAFAKLAVTMTGELCDCFATKRDGVHAILTAVEAVAGTVPVRVWQTDGRFVDPVAARAAPLRTAAANWMALATFAGRFVPEGAALLVDVGSTTADVVPLWNGRPVPRGRTDAERLRTHELVYTGVRRTPVCALLGPAVMAEFFATTLDAYLLLGHLPEDPTDHGTADGRPATRAAAHDRIARMLGADGPTCSPDESLALAARVHNRQLALLYEAVAAVASGLPERPRTVLVAGSGEFLAREAVTSVSVDTLSLAERLGPAVSEAACAYAVAVLAAEASA